ncbi:MAG: methyltransferase domain-containing protein, partial [Hyphomonadaceae bacterium]|nr:methyltransferase domain-containing protein [Clostridia bacterium]
LERTKAFEQGLFYMQDEASMLVAQALDPQKGQKILDVCAAPGGKATFLAQLMADSGTVTAWDIHAHKMALIEQNAKRLGLHHVTAQTHDATELDKTLVGQYDGVLVDAPCSGLGIIRRKPDIKWHKNLEDLNTILAVQRKILTTSAHYVKPGGVLVYSTCTIEKEENEGMIEKFLQTHIAFERCDISALFPNKSTAKEGFVTLYPHTDDTDGFFIAKMRRKVE